VLAYLAVLRFRAGSLDVLAMLLTKIWPKEVHIEYWMQTKEGWSVELKSIATHSLGDNVRSIMKWSKLPMGPSETLLL
jgi:hypothetical protein